MRAFLWCLVVIGGLSQFQVIGNDSSPQDHPDYRRKRLDDFHHQLRKRFFEDLEFGDDSGIDSLFDNVFDQTSLLGSSKLFKSQWREEKEGRVLSIKPEDKDTQIDIDVKDDLVTLKSKYISKNQHLESTQSFSVPFDVDGSKVKIEKKNSNIELFFPYKKPDSTRRQLQPFRPKNKRIPLPTTPKDIDI